MSWLKFSTVINVQLGPFLDDTDGKTAETGLDISQADIRLSKNGASFAQKNNASTAVHDAAGWYICPLNATDTGSTGRLIIAVHKTGALPVWKEYIIAPVQVYDSIVDGSDSLEVDATAISGDATAADNAEKTFDGTGFYFQSCIIPFVSTVNLLSLVGDKTGYLVSGCSYVSVVGDKTNYQASIVSTVSDKSGYSASIVSTVSDKSGYYASYVSTVGDKTGYLASGVSYCSIAGLVSLVGDKDGYWASTVSTILDKSGYSASIVSTVSDKSGYYASYVSTIGDKNNYHASIVSTVSDKTGYLASGVSYCSLVGTASTILDKTGYWASIVSTVSDKTGYLVSACSYLSVLGDKTGLLVSGCSYVSVIGDKLDYYASTVSTVLDKTGYIASYCSNLSTIALNYVSTVGYLSVLGDKTGLLVSAVSYVSTVGDKISYYINGTKTTLDVLNDITASSVWAATISDVAAKANITNGAVITAANAIRALFNRFFRKVTQTATQQVVKNDSDVSIAEMTTSDDGTTQTKGLT